MPPIYYYGYNIPGNTEKKEIVSTSKELTIKLSQSKSLLTDKHVQGNMLSAVEDTKIKTIECFLLKDLCDWQVHDI